MATCRNLLGEQPEERLRGWFHNGEDNLRGAQAAARGHLSALRDPAEELQGWLFVTSGNEFPLRVAQGYSNLEINELLIKHIREASGT